MGAPPAYWREEDESNVKGWEKTLGLCKGAVIKGVVTLAGEEAIANILWEAEESGGWFVQKMVEWVKMYPGSGVDVSMEEGDSE